MQNTGKKWRVTHIFQILENILQEFYKNLSFVTSNDDFI